MIESQFGSTIRGSMSRGIGAVTWGLLWPAGHRLAASAGSAKCGNAMLVLTVAAVFAAPAFAGDSQPLLYRCVEKGKPTIIQAAPCPATARIVRIASFDEVRRAPDVPVASAPTPPSNQQPSQEIFGAASPFACFRAKLRRMIMVPGQSNESGGLDLHRVLSGAVATACNQ